MPGGSISYQPVQLPGQQPTTPGGIVPVSSGESESGPYAPQYIGEAADVLGKTLQQGQDNYQVQAQRLKDFVQQLWNLRSQVMNQAKSAAARGANGQQNPLAVHQAVQELANQAGIPFTAEISKTLMAGNSIENSLTDLMTKIGQTYGQLGSINQSHSQSVGQGGGGVISLGGDRGNGKDKGQGNDKGIYTDIYGNKYSSGNRPPQFEGIAWADQQHAINASRDAAANAGQNKPGATMSFSGDGRDNYYPGNDTQFSGGGFTPFSPSADNPITGSGAWNGPSVPTGFFNPQSNNGSSYDPIEGIYGEGGNMPPQGLYSGQSFGSNYNNYPSENYSDPNSGYDASASWF